jgi:hypothetical protein
MTTTTDTEILYCCYLDEAAKAESASWQPSDVSMSDPAEHQRRHERIRELTCQDTGDIFMLVDGPTPDDFTHACRTHLGVLIDRDKVTEVYLARAEIA